MSVILSNYGLRLLEHSWKTLGPDAVIADPTLRRLAEIRAETLVADDGSSGQRELIARGLAQQAGQGASRESVELRYRRNPLEHIERVVFEYTTLCHLDCTHCRNGHIAPQTESSPGRLCEVVDAVVSLGITRFDFIGGEVTLFGKGWLEVVGHARRHPGVRAAVVTSGWFLGERDFWAAGRRYEDDRAFLAALAEAGLTHVVFSLDGPEAHHDACRGQPGLYRRVIEGLAKARQAKLEPRVSVVIGPTADRAGALAWAASLAEHLYGAPADAPLEQKLGVLTSDDFNYVSNFIDVGSAVRLRRGKHDVGDIPDASLRCKNFFRPHPSLRVQASGEVSLCPLVDSGEGYGNIHRQRPIDLLNAMQEAFLYRLHAEGEIARYRPLLDASLFGASVDHVCSLRTVLGMIARRIDERGVSFEDAEAIRQINLEVASKAGFLPAQGRRANGARRPR